MLACPEQIEVLGRLGVLILPAAAAAAAAAAASDDENENENDKADYQSPPDTK
jgi:hypothetical protein